MTRPLNYASELSVKRIEKIITSATNKSICALDVSSELQVGENTARSYLIHLRTTGAITEDYRSNKTVFYKATGVYHPEILDITAEDQVRSAPYVKPFRCDWTQLFFGPR